MKQFLLNFLNRYRLIRQLFTAAIYILILRHPAPDRVALVETNVEHFGTIAHSCGIRPGKSSRPSRRPMP